MGECAWPEFRMSPSASLSDDSVCVCVGGGAPGYLQIISKRRERGRGRGREEEERGRGL